MDTECDLALRARVEVDARESDQLLDGAGDACDDVVQVELDDLAAGARSGVANPHGNVEFTVGRDLVGAAVQLVDGERGVRASVAEGEQRGRVDGADALALETAERRLQIGRRLRTGRARD